MGGRWLQGCKVQRQGQEQAETAIMIPESLKSKR